MNHAALMYEVIKAMDRNSTDPITEMRQLGKALVEIADALQGCSNAEARAVIQAVKALL